MRYAQYCPKTGLLLGHYANEQSYTTVCIPDDHPDIADYNLRRDHARITPVGVRVNSTVIKSAWARGLTRLLAKHLGMTEQELVAAIKDEAAEPYLGMVDAGGKEAWELETARLAELEAKPKS
jgi:hypothetical protein